ncbi:MAG: hypothetical protein QME68_02825, partial [Elusimicrobiota bacterium]|nr:hypothetical protein [Elusimicrobiota bacterium]
GPVTVTVDPEPPPNGQITEWNEIDNSLTKSIFYTKPLPDLVILSKNIVFIIDNISTTTVPPAQNFKIQATVVNSGYGSVEETQSFPVNIYFTEFSTTVYISGPIPVNSTKFVQVDATAPSTHTYRIVEVAVDKPSNVPEIDDTYNNIATRVLIVGCPIELKITPTDISFDPVTPESGDVVTISATVHNLGTRQATDVVVKFWRGDPDAGGVQIGEKTITVSGFSSTTTYFRWNIPPEIEGSTEIFVTAELPMVGMEADITNNKASKTLNILDKIPPAAVTDLTLSIVNGTSVILGWTSPGDNNWNGNIENGKWRIDYATYTKIWNYIDYKIEITTTCSPLSAHSYQITGLSHGLTYYFCLWTADEVPNWSDKSNIPKIITNMPPNAPTSLGPTQYVNGSWGNNPTPILQFTQSDPDTTDTLEFRIQISTFSDFSINVVDYTSELISQGPTNYTLPFLSEGTYYWRVMSIDQYDATSPWTLANNGNIAFRIDLTLPTVPVMTEEPLFTPDTKNTVYWSESTNGQSGVKDYYCECDDNSDFSSPYTNSG